MSQRQNPKVLLVNPRFSEHSFWNYQETCKVVGARYVAAPLGLITVAALLPADWTIRLADRNIEELRDDDLRWADLVMVGGMLPQQRDAKRIIAMAHACGRPVVMGGPDVTASPAVYAEADFRVIGEAEEVMGEFVAAWLAGEKRGVFTAKEFPDLTTSPVPRFDLLKLSDYMHVGVQFSRGCPFNCEFCNVIELNGRICRLKTPAQMLRELDALYALGYRGHVDFVDDNLIGNRRTLKPFLAELAQWLRLRGNPFEFSSEASLNLADDAELLAAMRDAGFFAIFVGIETSDTKTLVSTNKLQNARRDIAASIGKINRAGIFANAGFIVGFDAEGVSIAQAMID
ncbi:MAG: radical SAM protein, partial [Proteobacteria bacterium]|nr:radical SAM protein [Pseudomonadota bacterium]